MDARRRLQFGPPGRRRYFEIYPEAVALVKRLHKDALNRGKRRTLRELSAVWRRKDCSIILPIRITPMK